MGLDKPVPEQLVLYLSESAAAISAARMMTGQPVLKDLRERLPASLELTFTALLIALIAAVPLGMVAALAPGSIVDHGVRLFCTLGVCVPTFVSGLLLIYVFYYLLGLAPDPTGRIDVFTRCRRSSPASCSIDFALAGDVEGWWAACKQLILPAVTHGAVRDRAAGADHARLDAGRRSAAISSAPRARSDCPGARWS